MDAFANDMGEVATGGRLQWLVVTRLEQADNSTSKHEIVSKPAMSSRYPDLYALGARK